MEKLWQGFDPEKDYWDRRLLYEVTGERLNEAEFCGDDTSDLDVENVGMSLINRREQQRFGSEGIGMEEFTKLTETLIDKDKNEGQADEPSTIN